MSRSTRLRLGAVLVTATLLVSAVLAPAASATGSSTDSAFSCSGSNVTIRPPRVSTNNAKGEGVYWAPILYQWQNGTWVDVATAGWAYAVVNNQGYAVRGWRDLAKHFGVDVRSFAVYQAGSYTVQNYVVWEDGTSVLTWVPSADTTGVCTFASPRAPAGLDVVAEADQPVEAEDFLVQIMRPASGFVALVLDAIANDSPVTGASPPTPS